MRIAVINHDFSGYTGSEIVGLEVANYFAELGHDVTIRAERISEDFAKNLYPTASAAYDRIDIAEYDVVWDQNGHFCLNTRDIEALRKWEGLFISVHLSGHVPAASYTHPFATRYSQIRVYNSQETRDKLNRGKELPGNELNMRNAAPSQFHVPPGDPKGKLFRLLVVSNHLPEEVSLAIEKLQERQIEVTHMGKAGGYRLIRPEDIIAADAILTIGKTTQYALCCGRPVYCYDYFGGPGWITEENFESAEYHNFSGRCCEARKTPGIIVDELISGFEYAEAFAINSWGKHSERYSLAPLLDRVLEERAGYPFDSEKCVEELDALRGALLHLHWIWEDVYSKKRLAAHTAVASRTISRLSSEAQRASEEFQRTSEKLRKANQLIKSLGRSKKKYRNASITLLVAFSLSVITRFFGV